MSEAVPATPIKKRERYGAGVHQLDRKQPLLRRFGKFWHQL